MFLYVIKYFIEKKKESINTMHNIFKILQDIRFTLLTNTILIAHD